MAVSLHYLCIHTACRPNNSLLSQCQGCMILKAKLSSSWLCWVWPLLGAFAECNIVGVDKHKTIRDWWLREYADTAGVQQRSDDDALLEMDEHFQLTMTLIDSLAGYCWTQSSPSKVSNFCLKEIKRDVQILWIS